MTYESDLRFLRDTLQRNHISLSLLSPYESVSSLFDTRLRNILGTDSFLNMNMQKYLGRLHSHTLYKFTDEFKLQHFCLALPESDDPLILIIGPYLSSPLSDTGLFELEEQLGLNPNLHKYLEEYYTTVPLISDNDHLFSMLDTFCEHIWHSLSFDIEDLHKPDTSAFISINTEPSTVSTYDDLNARLNSMETRYAFENELIQTVILGQQHKVQHFLSALDEIPFEMRSSDPVRNAKNYCIIMNTLLRKAAEHGGVHPLYIDRISSDFAKKIEASPSVKKTIELMKDMFTSYCRLVYKHSIRQYSPPVQKAMLLIDMDLSADLTLHTLAEHLEISSGYLATVFKKDTGYTLSEYIWDKRIQHAIHLLLTTNLQIQTIALHCGIMNVQYFSKTFKRLTGTTPKEYRESHHGYL